MKKEKESNKKIKIIQINGNTNIQCTHCGNKIRVEDIMELGEHIADVIVFVCSECNKEIVVRKEK